MSLIITGGKEYNYCMDIYVFIAQQLQFIILERDNFIQKYDLIKYVNELNELIPKISEKIQIIVDNTNFENDSLVKLKKLHIYNNKIKEELNKYKSDFDFCKRYKLTLCDLLLKYEITPGYIYDRKLIDEVEQLLK